MEQTSNHLISIIHQFLIDRSARGRSPRTLQYYRDELDRLAQDLGDLPVETITPTHLREFFLRLGQHRSTGGVHVTYRAVKAFFRWFQEEFNLPTSPIDKVKVSPGPVVPRPGVPVSHVKAMVKTCGAGGQGQRDKALFLFLLDTGVRLTECLELQVGDVDLISGEVRVRRGKGGKPRTVFLGAVSRRELARFLRQRPQALGQDPLFSTREGRPLTKGGLREIVRRHASQASVPEPGLHDFRRTFALESLRNGMDIYALMRLMGHTSPTVLMRYLALVKEDVQKAHRRSSPVDNW